MKPEEWLEGLKTPVFIDDPVGGTCKDSIHAHRATFLEEGARIVRDLLAQVDALRDGVAVVVPELAGDPVLQEEFSDNGKHSHWNLFDSGNGELIWTEAPEEEWHKHHRRPAHSVPSSRVLKDGEVAVDAEYFAALRYLQSCARKWRHGEVSAVPLLNASAGADALRAHGKEGAP